MNWIPIALAGGVVAALVLSRNSSVETPPSGGPSPERGRAPAPAGPPEESRTRIPSPLPPPPPDQVPRPRNGGLGQMPLPSSPTPVFPPLMPPPPGTTSRPSPGRDVFTQLFDPALQSAVTELQRVWLQRADVPYILAINEAYNPKSIIVTIRQSAIPGNISIDATGFPGNFRGFPIRFVNVP